MTTKNLSGGRLGVWWKAQAQAGKVEGKVEGKVRGSGVDFALFGESFFPATAARSSWWPLTKRKSTPRDPIRTACGSPRAGVAIRWQRGFFLVVFVLADWQAKKRKEKSARLGSGLSEWRPTAKEKAIGERTTDGRCNRIRRVPAGVRSKVPTQKDASWWAWLAEERGVGGGRTVYDARRQRSGETAEHCTQGKATRKEQGR